MQENITKLQIKKSKIEEEMTSGDTQRIRTVGEKKKIQ